MPMKNKPGCKCCGCEVFSTSIPDNPDDWTERDDGMFEFNSPLPANNFQLYYSTPQSGVFRAHLSQPFDDTVMILEDVATGQWLWRWRLESRSYDHPTQGTRNYVVMVFQTPETEVAVINSQLAETFNNTNWSQMELDSWYFTASGFFFPEIERVVVRDGSIYVDLVNRYAYTAAPVAGATNWVVSTDERPIPDNQTHRFIGSVVLPLPATQVYGAGVDGFKLVMLGGFETDRFIASRIGPSGPRRETDPVTGDLRLHAEGPVRCAEPGYVSDLIPHRVLPEWTVEVEHPELQTKDYQFEVHHESGAGSLSTTTPEPTEQLQTTIQYPIQAIGMPLQQNPGSSQFFNPYYRVPVERRYEDEPQVAFTQSVPNPGTQTGTLPDTSQTYDSPLAIHRVDTTVDVVTNEDAPNKLDVIVNVSFHGVGYPTATGSASVTDTWQNFVATVPEFTFQPILEGDIQGEYAVVSLRMEKTIDRWSGAIPTLVFTSDDTVATYSENDYFAGSETYDQANISWTRVSINNVPHSRVEYDVVRTRTGRQLNTDDIIVRVKPSGVTQAPFAELEV